MTGDVGLAEDLAQDALVAALEQWPAQGVPDNPGAWLTAVARRRYVDTVRRAVTFERKAAELDVQARLDTKTENPMDEIEFDTHVTDDVLKLIFTACHPVLTRDGRVALTLKLVGGLSTEQVARAFLVPTPTMAARITRAKKALADANVGFEVPVGPELANRFASVLEVVYLIFNEGYAATSGESWYRAELCDEAMRLGRMLSALAPEEPEAHGLVALMEIQASRIPARTGPGGAPVTLLEQDRGRWNRLLDHPRPGRPGQGEGGGAQATAPQRHAAGPYVLQAELAACHARAATAADTDWRRIVGALRDPRRARPVPGHRAQPRRRGRHGGQRHRPGPGAGHRRFARGRPGAARLPPAARGPRRPARPPGPSGPGPRGIRARGRAHRQRQRARPPAPPRRRAASRRAAAAATT